MQNTDTTQKDQDTGVSTKIEIEKEDNTSMQRYFTDTQDQELKGKIALCGWFLKPAKKGDIYLNQGKEIITREYGINKATRVCNEACATMVTAKIDGLTSQITQGSIQTDLEIYREWLVTSKAIRFDLIDNFFIGDEIGNKNSYEIKHDGGILSIMAYVDEYQTFTRKSNAGFLTKKYNETFMTLNTLQQKSMLDSEPQRKGIIDHFLGKKG